LTRFVDNSKAENYLKRNASGPGGGQDESGDEREGEDEDQPKDGREDYEDDYTQNIRHSAKKGQTTSLHSNKRSHHGYDHNDLRSGKKQKDLSHGHNHDRSSSPAPLPFKPTMADMRHADKVVAREQARDKALGASRDRVGTKPTAAPKGKDEGKGKGKEAASKLKGDCCKDSDDDDDEVSC
jgi:hypothetical protein